MDTVELTLPQLKCLASPACNAIYVALRGLGQASAAEIGRSVGRSPATVHYHVKCLLESGLVREAFRRPTTRKPEAVFEPAAQRVRLPKTGPDSGVSEYARRAVVAGLRQVMRGYERAARETSEESGGIHVLRAQLRLKPADLDRFVEMIEAASKFAEANRTEEEAITHWSSICYPDIPT